MSHYTVLIQISKKRLNMPKGADIKDYSSEIYDIVNNMLDPYDENMEVDSYIYKTYDEIVQDAKTSIQSWRERSESRLTSLIPSNETKALTKTKWIAKFGGGESDYKYYKSIAKMIQKEDNQTIINKDYHDWYVDSYGLDCDEEGNALSTYNPNSKWDWFQIGGRWNGLLKLKNGLEVNAARKGDLDLEKMYSLTPEEKQEKTDFWNEYVLAPELTEELKRKYLCFYKQQYYLDAYKDLEGYLKYCAVTSTYAVLTKDKQWCAPGEMGWWGCSSEEPDEHTAWAMHFKENFIDTLDDDDIIVVVDCHI